jgi:hypothetical protein
LQTGTEGQAAYANSAEGTSSNKVVSHDGSNGKYEIHLNVSSLSGCFFNFGPGANSPTFPIEKKD